MTAWTPVPDTAQRDRGREVAVGDELDPGAGLADLVDQRLVAGPLEDDDRDVVDRAGRAPRRSAARFSVGLSRMSTLPATTGPTQSFSRYVSGAWIEAALLRRGEDRDRAGLAVGDEVRALERVDGDVDLGDVRRSGRRPPADLLADVEHRRLVALALADDDRAGELDLVHRPAHRLDRGAVGVVLLAAAHEARGRERRRLGDPDHLEREQLLHRTSSCRSERGGPAAHQCRKCRVPVKTIARWWRSATSIAISSRIEPPGWTIAVTRPGAAIWMPSGNGK